MKHLEKILGRAMPVKGKAAGKVRDPVMEKAQPGLHELMTLSETPDGKARQVCSLLVFAEDGMWKGCLSERDMGLSLWASGATLQDVLRSLEERLQSDNPEWRKKQPRKRPGKAAGAADD